MSRDELLGLLLVLAIVVGAALAFPA